MKQIKKVPSVTARMNFMMKNRLVPGTQLCTAAPLHRNQTMMTQHTLFASVYVTYAYARNL